MNEAGRGMARLGLAWLGTARHGKARGYIVIPVAHTRVQRTQARQTRKQLA